MRTSSCPRLARLDFWEERQHKESPLAQITDFFVHGIQNHHRVIGVLQPTSGQVKTSGHVDRPRRDGATFIRIKRHKRHKSARDA
ncbi:hypothetical protein EVAR_79372_1 [Eumeta japonica]|uniref:Uncharacterized protein n=1 Tax=Eumeta variegata TaxID=151549 RepID=A0A4C1TG12_EUMVA|nr:hypothetical protein EVAR_79372_1 [Eumeta japonica]